jgi:hypothetical protein
VKSITGRWLCLLADQFVSHEDTEPTLLKMRMHNLVRVPLFDVL